MKSGEDAPDHDGAGVQGLCEEGGGLHRFRGEGEDGEDADTQTESTVLGHVGNANISGGSTQVSEARPGAPGGSPGAKKTVELTRDTPLFR